MTKWLIDFDSTLSDTFKHQLELINLEFGTSYVEEDFTSWATEDILPREIVQFMWSEKCFLSHEFQLECQAVPHAIAGVKKLMLRGDECRVVSDRPQMLYDTTKKWLDFHGLPQVPVTFTRSVHSKSDQLTAIMTKAQIAYLYKLTHVVEDAPHHSLYLAERGYIEKVYMIDKPSNRHIEHEKIQRIYSWEEVE